MKTIKNIVFGFIIGVITTIGVVTFGTDIIRNSYFNSDLKLAINNHQVSDIRIITVELEGEQYGRNYYSIADLIKAINDYGGISAKVDFDSETKTTVVEIGNAVTENVYNDSNPTTVIPTPTPIPYPEYIPDPNPSIEPTPTPALDTDPILNVDPETGLDSDPDPIIEPETGAENQKEGGSATNMQPEVLTNITDYIFNEETGEETFTSNGVKYITSHSVIIAVDKNKNLSIAIRSGNKSYIHKKFSMDILMENIPNKVYKDTNGNVHACFEYDYYLNTLLPFIEGWTE